MTIPITTILWLVLKSKIVLKYEEFTVPEKMQGRAITALPKFIHKSRRL